MTEAITAKHKKFSVSLKSEMSLRQPDHINRSCSINGQIILLTIKKEKRTKCEILGPGGRGEEAGEGEEWCSQIFVSIFTFC